MRDKSRNRPRNPEGFVPRKASRFNIGPDSHPRKVVRWMKRGGGVSLAPAKLAKAAARHVHPHHKRLAARDAVREAMEAA